jgi:drug/metabolite transporter (DMT)-like permease
LGPILLTVLALISFAANSILCRLALAAHEIDPSTFTVVRLASGALMLVSIVAFRNRGSVTTLRAGNWVSAAMLFCYATTFSFAYVGMKAGVGALILFGSVQVTMILATVQARHSPTLYEWVGLVLAMGGLVWLVAPGVAAPPLSSALLMALAGISWGVYSLRGRAATDPIGATAGNFAGSLAFALVLTFFLASATPRGYLWAAVSGAVTSGCGYVLWYAALPWLGATRAAIAQLTVPILAATAGILLLGEPFTLRLGVSAGITLSGVALAVFAKK